jgi:2'-5' RNA ligase
MRVFVALDLPGEVRQRLNLLAFLLPLPRRVPPENMHITLSFLGEVSGPLAEEVHHALDALHAPAFALTLAGVGLFGGAQARAAYAGVAPEPLLAHLARKVETAARRAGAPPEQRRFVPHVTLGRFRPGEADAARLERAVVEHQGFTAGPFAVRDFVFYRSHLTGDGAAYEELARYPLG